MGEKKAWELSNSYGIEITYDDEYYDYLEELREQDKLRTDQRPPLDEIPEGQGT